MHRLLYVSESCIDPADSAAAIEKLVEDAKLKNAQLDLTGALIFTGDHFAQVLEGSLENLERIMTSICRDPRHKNVNIVDKSPITSRLFPSWGMAYQGPSNFVSRHVARLMHTTAQSERQQAGGWLTDLASEFSRTSASAR